MQPSAKTVMHRSLPTTDQTQADRGVVARPSFASAEVRWPVKLSVCLPAYNEQDCIVETLDRALAVLPALVASLEVIVVDDGSRDATAQQVNTVIARDGRVRLVVHERNKGYGSAVTSGLLAATGDLVMFADSDGQFDFRDVARLLDRLPGNDFVVGYRHQRAESFRRRLNAWAWGRLVRLIYGVRARDLDCAFKLFRRAVIQRLRLTAKGACINAELMCQCQRAGFRFTEVPVEHYLRKGGRATGSNLKVIARAFRELPWIETQPLPAPPPSSRPDRLARAA